MEHRHEPVLLAEVLEALAVKRGGVYVDGTVGLAGHATAILERNAPDGRLLAVDRDAESLALTRQRLAFAGQRVRFAHADFREVPALLAAERADGILLDLGISSAQLDDPGRGFSFRNDGPLDMRMDRTQGVSATEIVNRWPEHELADLIFRFGEERGSRRIARAIVTARRQARITSTTQLADIVRRAARAPRGGDIDPATRTFQALRICVNGELEQLGAAVTALARCLVPGGRIVVISFHSLEDREVKHAFAALAREELRLVTRKPLRATPAELQANPRCRSARLRVAERSAA